MLSCYDYAIKILYAHPKTEQDLKIKMMQRGYPLEEIEKTMIHLKRKKYIDDHQYATLYIESECVKKGKPVYLIRQKLLQKGVSKMIINQVVGELQEEMSDGIEKKLLTEIQKYKKKNVEGFDIIQKLIRKGYKIADIKKVIKQNFGG